jgi:hypothetical protein
MKDESDKRLDELLSAARAQKPDTSRLEYGFETRLMGRLREERNEAKPWYAFAWRLSPVFAGIVVALGVWTYYSPHDPEMQTVADTASDESQMVDYLTGNGI